MKPRWDASSTDEDLDRLIRTGIPGGYDPFRDAGDCHFDADRARLAIGFFADHLVFIEGECAGKPFLLETWQAAIVANAFGWLRPDGTRRYREVFIFVGRKNGKTPLAAGIALFTLLCDGEPGAQVYSAAAELSQAALVYRHAAGMVARNPALAARCRPHRTGKSIQVESTGSFFRSLSSDDDTKHGLNVHAVVIDELHAHKTGDLTDVLVTGTASRRQPLVVYITTSDYERVSICNQKHDYAKHVRDGGLRDAAFLPVIYEADGAPWTETIRSFAALDRLDRLCTCGCVSPTLIARLWREVSAGRVTTDGGGSGRSAPNSDGAPDTRTGSSGAADSARPATSSGSSIATPTTRPGLPESAPSGLPATESGCVQRTLDGSKSPAARRASQSADAASSMDSRSESTTRCATGRTASAPSASAPPSSGSITATIRAECEGSSAEPATLDSVFSETLSRVYDAHAPTCGVRTARVAGSALLVEHPADDWARPEVWAKANPNLGVSVKPEYLERECQKAIQSPLYRNTFLRLHLNLRTATHEVLFDPVKWDACAGVPAHLDPREQRAAYEDFAAGLVGRPCFGGLDLATTTDLIAFALFFPAEGAILVWLWSPRETAVERGRVDRVPYLGWSQDGWLTLTDGWEGRTADYDRIETDIRAVCDRYLPKVVNFDPYGANHMVSNLRGHGVEMASMRQGFLSLSPPTKELLRLVVGRALRHGAHAVLRWMIGHAQAEMDPAGNIKLSKAKSRERIDGLAAAVMAIGASQVDEVAGPSVYEKRGPLVVG